MNEFLAGKKFLTGDQVCNEDASVFGLLVQIIYVDSDSPIQEFLLGLSFLFYVCSGFFLVDDYYFLGECPNLVKYVHTMKAKFWADWDQELAKKKPN